MKLKLFDRMSLPKIIDFNGDELSYASLSMSRGLGQLTSQLQFSSHELRTDLINQVVRVRDRRGGNTLFSGYVETIKGNAFESFSYSARSFTVDLIRFDADGNELFKNSRVNLIVNSIADRIGVFVDKGVPADRVPRFRLQRGEDMGTALHRLAETYRFTVTDTADGNLRAYRTPSAASLAWVDGVGTVTRPISAELDFSEWRDVWVCRGQREIVTDDIERLDAGQIRTEVAIASERPSRRVLPNRSATSKADARNLVEWHAKLALGNTIRLTVVHSEWPGEVGDRVRIKVPSLNIDEDFIVANLALEASSSAVQVTASCVLPEVYSFRPLPVRRSVAKRVSTWKVLGGVEVPK